MLLEVWLQPAMDNPLPLASFLLGMGVADVHEKTKQISFGKGHSKSGASSKNWTGMDRECSQEIMSHHVSTLDRLEGPSPKYPL